MAGIFLLLLLAWMVLSQPRNPVALIRVVDAKGNPVAGAVITPDGLRPKSGPYASGHYGWNTRNSGVSNAPVHTDASGYARVPYPQFVFERIETGQISFSVSHPDFVSDRPFRDVATEPPAGAPWQVWWKYLWDRIRANQLIAHTDPVILNRGAILKLSASGNTDRLRDSRLFAQVSGVWRYDNGFWSRPEPGTIVTRRIPPGKPTVRAFLAETNGAVWFSDVVSFNAVSGQTNDVTVPLLPGVALYGELDANVPRPVTNGRVIAQVAPHGFRPQDSPPQWHAWSEINADGTFAIASLPAGDLEIVALCDGFVSTNGPSTFSSSMHFPQKHEIATNDLTITIGMERTAWLEVRVLDDKGNPLSGARVATWPNVQYGGWSSTILASDCYNTLDAYGALQAGKMPRWHTSVPGFDGETDAGGLAVLRNLPVETRQFTVEHTNFILPAVADSSGQKRREVSIALIPGATNRSTVKLEPKDQSPISHY